MGRQGPNTPCPCGSERKYKKCCGLLHRGGRAPSPEALMRSRYSAYALGLVDYILHTADPAGPHGGVSQRASVVAFCRDTRFEALEVLDASESGDRGTVSFRARLSRGGVDVSFGERSAFRRIEGRWLYLSGQPLDDTP